MTKAKPYGETRVPFDKSISDIRKILLKAGVTDYRVTEGEHVERGRIFMIEFIWPAGGESTQDLPVQFDLEIEDDAVELRRQGRFLYWLIKSKVENVLAGFRSPLQEFIGEIVIAPGTTIQQRVESQLRSGQTVRTLKLLPTRGKR